MKSSRVTSGRRHERKGCIWSGIPQIGIYVLFSTSVFFPLRRNSYLCEEEEETELPVLYSENPAVAEGEGRGGGRGKVRSRVCVFSHLT